MEEWKECRLGDYCDFQNGYAFKSSEFKTNGEYKIVKIKELKDGLVKFFDDSASVDVQDIKEFEKYKINRNDVLFALTGDPVSKPNPLSWVGRVSIYRSDDNALLNQRTCKIKKSERIDNKFLYYYFRQWENFYALASKATGSASQANISTNTIADTIIKLPPLPTQQKIAAILSSFDDKIELNNKINTNLEQQAQALFKNWFVDFEPFGGKMPEGWKVGKLSDVLRLKKNSIQPGDDTSLPYLPIDLIPIKSLAIREVRPNEEALSSLLRFEENDILIGAMRVYFHRVAIAPFDGITRTTCFVLEPFNSNYFAYAAITCNQDLAIDYAQKTSKGSTMPYAVWEGGLGDFEIPIPDEATAKKFNIIVKPLLEQIKRSFFENKNLSEQRDSLLPKLMNGEIEV